MARNMKIPCALLMIDSKLFNFGEIIRQYSRDLWC